MKYLELYIIKTLWLCLIFILGFSFAAQAQESRKVGLAKAHLGQHKSFNLNQEDLYNLQVQTLIEDEKTGITHLYFKQIVNGLEVSGAQIGVHLKNDKVFHATNRFEPNSSVRAKGSSPSLSAVAALRNALQELGLSSAIQRLSKGPIGIAQNSRISSDALAEDAKCQLVYKKDERNLLLLSWQLELYEANHQHYWLVWVDALSGKIIEKRDLVIACNHGGSPLVSDDHLSNIPEKAQSPLTTTCAEHPIHTTENVANMGNQYRVYDMPYEAPNDPGATHSLVTNDGDMGASPYGWHSIDGSTFQNVTIGNNVNARNDLGAVSPPGTLPDHPAVATSGITPPFVFDYPADLSLGAETYTDAAIVNLFYWNNLMHDVFHPFGFDEKNGNFQTTNTFNGDDKGGLGGDAVLAEAQDGEATNNANMLTLPDGTPPRMQMYLWTASVKEDLVYLNTVNGIPNTDTYEGIEASFGTGNNLDATGVTGDLVLIDANFLASGADEEGCGSGQGTGLLADNAGAMTGNIALISRGSCAFIEKIHSAQLSGATAAIVYNNIPGADPIAMGGAETGSIITIPSLMISFDDAQLLLADMALGTVNLTLRKLGPPNNGKDGDFDNGIIAHEYGHGISNRLTGGPDALGPLGGDEQGGEGWSDFFALYMTTTSADLAPATADNPNGVLPHHGIGTYVFYQDINGGGIRPARYSIDMSVNPYTFADADNGEEISVPHGVGFIWCTMLYEMTQNLIDKYGINDDLYNNGTDPGAGGNNIALRLVLEGLKLQPIGPTFIEMRDGILRADTALFNGDNSCEIWRAFAKRGLGFQATSGTNSLGDEFENFDLPIGCGGEANALLEITKKSEGILENNDTIEFTITVYNRSKIYAADNVIITNNLGPNTSFVSASNGGTSSGNDVIYPTIATLAPDETVTRTARVSISRTGTLTNLLFRDNQENGTANWTPDAAGANVWSLVNNDPFSGNNVWFAQDPDNYSNQTLTMSAPQAVIAGTQMSFFHQFATESAFDAGVAEISIDNGVTWTDLGADMTQNGYNDNVSQLDNAFLNGPAFGGASGGYLETLVDLAPYAGNDALFRFRFASDVGTPGNGWWMDDVLIYVNPIYEFSSAKVDADLGLSVQADARVLMLDATNLPLNLIDFSATANGNSIDLDWITANEIGTDRFEVQRATDRNNDFDYIGEVKAHGGESENFYALKDGQVSRGLTYYYRLKLIDTNGDFEYSPIRTARVEGDNSWSVSPNPNKGKFDLLWHGNNNQELEISLFNVDGKLMRQQKLNANPGEKHGLDFSGLAPNVYMIQLKSDDKVETKKMIIR